MTTSDWNSCILFAFWCIFGWLLVFVRNSEAKMSFIMWETTGYKKTSAFAGVLAIVLWPLSPLITIAVNFFMLKHLKKKKAIEEKK